MAPAVARLFIDHFAKTLYYCPSQPRRAVESGVGAVERRAGSVQGWTVMWAVMWIRMDAREGGGGDRRGRVYIYMYTIYVFVLYIHIYTHIIKEGE